MTPTTNSTEKEEGWVEHTRDDCPTHSGDMVEVEFEGGARWIDKASQWSWKRLDDQCNIIAYRIVEGA